MQEFERVVAQGTAEEKKLFVRGFVERVGVNPTVRSAMISILPLIPPAR